jgi:hypothetical protein
MSGDSRPRLAPALGAFTLSVLAFGGSWVTAEPSTITGRAVAVQARHPAAESPARQPDVAAQPVPRPAVQGSWLTEVTRPPSQAQQASAPIQTPGPAPQPALAQQLPGTLVLARGGTARLVRAEVGRDGRLPIPSGVDQATWWGVGLGSGNGATVFAGHVNWAGVRGPFAELWEARDGDRVAVVDGSGRTWAFRVSQVLTLGKDELPTRAAVLFGPSGAHRVVLVTCGGRWVGGAEGYASNRIVIATPVP